MASDEDVKGSKADAATPAPDDGALPETDLTPQQARFVEEYLIDLNATAAAKRASYSAHTARQIASRLLATPHVQDAIQAAMQKRSRRTEVTQDRVIKELARLAFSRMTDFATWTSDEVIFNASNEVDHEDAACISEIVDTESEKSSSLRIKLHDKTKALELLGKHLKLFADRVEHSGPDGKAIVTRQEASNLTAEELDARIQALLGGGQSGKE